MHFGDFAALSEVSTTVARQSLHAFIGPNGSGKTTLFNVIVGRYRPRDGTVRWDGKDLLGLSVDERARRGITMKFQITSLFDGLTLAENMLLARIAHRCTRRGLAACLTRTSKGNQTAIAEALDQVGLYEKRAYLASELSHGQRAWLEIAMTLVNDPSLLLLDEPTSGMGIQETRKTVELVQRIRVDRTVLIIEHDMEFVRSLAETITVLDRGRVLMSGNYEQVKADERVVRAYLGTGREHASR